MSAVIEDRLRASARAHRRRMARRHGLVLDELDGITAECLANWARAKAAQALIDPELDPERFWRATNAVGRALGELERRLRDAGLDGRRDPGAALAAHVAERYGRNGDAA